jgi:hypothetical protein
MRCEPIRADTIRCEQSRCDGMRQEPKRIDAIRIKPIRNVSFRNHENVKQRKETSETILSESTRSEARR